MAADRVHCAPSTAIMSAVSRGSSAPRTIVDFPGPARAGKETGATGRLWDGVDSATMV